jgi:hypothetical protein
MESLDEISKNSGKGGFIKHVFNFDDDSKSEMLNIVQYAVLALIPVVMLNKLMQRFVPEADEDKSSLELSAEVLGQIIIMFIVMLFIHRIVTYAPTYSGEKYADFSVSNIILAMLVIILSLQTKLGEKVSILVDRLMELWEGPKDKKGKKKGSGSGSVKVSQPISQNQASINQSLNSMGSTSISALPNFDQMHQQDNTPLVGAATPGMGMDSGMIEPMAANAGGAFATPFGGLNW